MTAIVAELVWWVIVAGPPIAGLWIGLRLDARGHSWLAWIVGLATWLFGWWALVEIALHVPELAPEIWHRFG